MKKMLVAFITLFVCSSLIAQTKNFKRYPDKSGRIEYKWSGKMTGTEILIWDNWGQKEKRTTQTEMKLFGMTQNTHSTTLIIGDYVYTWNEGDMTGSKSKNPFMEALSENIEDWDKFSQESLKTMNYKKTGAETINGKNCNIWTGPNGKIWIYKSYPLKSETKAMGIEATQSATKYAAGQKVNSSELAIPSEITFHEVSDQFTPNENDDEQTKQTKEMMNNLLEGLK